MKRPSVNPFGDLIVKDPRRAEPAVVGLNDKPFRRLLSHFDRLVVGEAPRELISPEAAQLVTSEQPGYGKSHLIGRVFRQLHGRATLVYVLPFQNAATVFQSMMLAVARELHFPDRMDAGSWDREQPSQLDYFAHAVLAHVLADVVATGRDVHVDGCTKEEVIERLQENPLAAFNRGVSGPNWADWLRTHFEKLREPFESAVARKGLTLSAPHTWLKVLYAYAFNPFDTAVRRPCMDWLTGQPLDGDELKRLGLRASDAVHAEISPEEANELCRRRLVELCQLASFFRPFVFCFDQTEVYGHHPALARAFGKVIAVLINEAPNHLALITSNQEPWLERIVPYFEKADLDRIAQPPVTLEGLNRDEARELARMRMRAVDVEREREEAFLDERWIESLFPTPRNQMGTRHFLQKCKERWDSEPAKRVPVADLYRQRVDRLLASPKRHQFDPDTLQWLVEELGARIEGVTVTPVQEKYFNVEWRTAERTCAFGFVPGTHWQRWLAIAREIQKKNEGAGSPVKAVFFRAPYQPPVPAPTWKSAAEINAAKATCLHIIQLSLEELAALYAARDLYAEAAQGDVAATTDEVLAFLVKQLAPWWQRLGGPPEQTESSAAEQPPNESERPDDAAQALAREVRRVVERARFLSIDELLQQLNGTKPSREEVLAACGFSPEIKVHSHPNMIVLQWQTGV